MNRTAVRAGAAAGMLVLAVIVPALATQIEARAGYFVPSSRDVRDVYPNGLAFGADIAVPIVSVLQAWGGLDYFRRSGKLTLTGEPTTLRVVPLFAGLKLRSPGRSLESYAAAALGYFFYREASVIGTASGGRPGLVAQAGLLAKLKGRIWLDFHGRYTTVKAKSAGPDPVMTELGGFQGGLGIAYRF